MCLGSRKEKPISRTQLDLGIFGRKNKLPGQTLNSYLPRDAMFRYVFSGGQRESNHFQRFRLDQSECLVFRQKIIQLEQINPFPFINVRQSHIGPPIMARRYKAAGSCFSGQN
jgi:hypothetical protein